MSERVQRDIRKVAKQTATEMAPALEAALRNEQLTRHRVEALEVLLRRTFMGRLNWLLRGK